MKNKLPEYFEPSEVKIKEIWDNGTIVLDANVLLNLFRYSKNSREELIKIIKHYSERLWLPYQVAFEFLDNFERVTASLKDVLSETIKAIDHISGVLESHLKLSNYDKYHLLKPEELRNDIKKFQDSQRRRIEKIKSEYDSVDKQGILDEVVGIFEGKVGDDYTKDRLEDVFKEGEKRYKENVPPGYKDLDGKRGAPKRHLYGDLIWWMQVIDFAKENHRNLVIVTDDAKEDWWYKVNNETKRPRIELIREFAKQTDGQSFLMYRTGRFMELSKKYDKVTISAKSIKEVKETAVIDYSNLYKSQYQPLYNSYLDTSKPLLSDGIVAPTSVFHTMYSNNPSLTGLMGTQDSQNKLVSPLIPKIDVNNPLGLYSMNNQNVHNNLVAHNYLQEYLSGDIRDSLFSEGMEKNTNKK